MIYFGGYLFGSGLNRLRNLVFSRKEMKSTILFSKMFARIDSKLIPFRFRKGKCVVRNAKKG